MGDDESTEGGEEVMEKIYERFDFQGLDELLKIRTSLPVPERTNTREVKEIGGRFVNAGEFAIIHSGDRYNHGVWFKNSYDGSNALGSGFYAFRQVCTNGMMGWAKELLVRKIHLGQVKLGDWIKQAITDMRTKSTEFERMVQHAAEVRIEDDLKAVLERLEIGPMVGKKIEKRLETSDGITAYNVFNALTAYATHDLSEKPLAAENYNRIAQRILVAPEIVVKQR